MQQYYVASELRQKTARRAPSFNVVNPNIMTANETTANNPQRGGNGVSWVDHDGFDTIRGIINHEFTPGIPTTSLSKLIGRDAQVQLLMDVIASPGKHAFIFGDRGVGKTSMASSLLSHMRTTRARNICIQINCENETFSSTWKKILRRIRTNFDSQHLPGHEALDDDVTTDDVEFVLSRIDDSLILVFDEFQQISNRVSLSKFAALIKSFSDHVIDATFILIGSKTSASDLLKLHESIHINVELIELARFQLSELRSLLKSRWSKCGLDVRDDVLSAAVHLSGGLPYYCHIIGRRAALLAIANKRLIIQMDDIAYASRDINGIELHLLKNSIEGAGLFNPGQN